MSDTKKQPVIRAGQCKPYRKGTRPQINKRIREVAKLLRRGTRKMAIHRIMKTRFNVEWRQTDRYIAAACELTQQTFLLATGKPAKSTAMSQRSP